ncbi:MAG: bifunctional YncE family protein/alkaline phosphatase family protein [Pirellulales bacterium]
MRCLRSLIALCCLACVGPLHGAEDPQIEATTDLVGRWRDDAIVTPVNQRLTPFGRLLELPKMRPQALALSPDGRLLAVSGKSSELVIVDPASGQIKQRVQLPADDQRTPLPAAPSANILRPDKEGQISYTGLIFSPEGRRIYLSNVSGSIKVFGVEAQGQVSPSHTIPLPQANAPRRKEEIPSGLALSADGGKLYVCGNLSNRLLELDAQTGKVLRTFDVGVAPYDVALAGGKAFVSNWGGRRPTPGVLTGPAGRGTEVRVDPVRHIASEGSVSIVDLATGQTAAEVLTGLHACALAVSPAGDLVACANAGSDHVSVIDVATHQVIDTIWTKAKPSDLFGASPNALAFDATGETLFVANGTQNAVAVLHFEPRDKGDSRLEGLIPVGWFPGALTFDKARNTLYAANIKGLPSAPRKNDEGQEGFNSHQYQGSLSFVPIPNETDLAKLSELAARNLRSGTVAQAKLPPRAGQPRRAIPERIGEPSLIEHVVYVIKENRTYDQVFGALGRGRGRADLCIFGREVTPNQHKLVDEFVLLDNTYCSGILSADGHQWSTTAFSTDYMEKSFAGFPRSYPDGMGEDEADALAYSPAGFLWDNAVAGGVSLRNYGEFMMPTVRWRDAQRKGSPDYLSCYRTWQGKSDAVVFECEPAVETLRPFSPAAYVGWEMAVPDQYRADFILRELKEFEARGEYPRLVIICLPNDHTSGTKPGSPTPASCMADNDLAFGRIVEGLSHSKFWPKMAIFAIEDDPQAGWDHVSGYRTTAYCISPYAKRGAIVSTQYNTTSLLRTMEQILGLKPMNQFDASATPMFDCFVDTPDLRPFDAVPNKVPLDQMNPAVSQLEDPALREDAERSLAINFREVDKAPEDLLNRILWRAMRGSRDPYPEWAVAVVEDDDDD